MESIEDSMDPRTNEKHEKEHEYSKKEGKIQNNQLLYRESQRLPAWFEPTRSNQAEEMEVMMKNNICKKL